MQIQSPKWLSVTMKCYTKISCPPLLELLACPITRSKAFSKVCWEQCQSLKTSPSAPKTNKCMKYLQVSSTSFRLYYKAHCCIYCSVRVSTLLSKRRRSILPQAEVMSSRILHSFLKPPPTIYGQTSRCTRILWKHAKLFAMILTIRGPPRGPPSRQHARLGDG